MRRLSTETIESDIETGLAKLRYEIHRVQNNKRDFDIEYEGSEGKMMKL